MIAGIFLSPILSRMGLFSLILLEDTPRARAVTSSFNNRNSDQMLPVERELEMSFASLV